MDKTVREWDELRVKSIHLHTQDHNKQIEFIGMTLKMHQAIDACKEKLEQPETTPEPEVQPEAQPEEHHHHEETTHHETTEKEEQPEAEKEETPTE